jgi:hypothetical protein
VKQRAARECVKQNCCQCEGIKTVCCDEVVRAFLFDVLQAFAKTVYGDHKINEIGHCIDWLTD